MTVTGCDSVLQVGMPRTLNTVSTERWKPATAEAGAGGTGKFTPKPFTNGSVCGSRTRQNGQPPVGPALDKKKHVSLLCTVKFNYWNGIAVNALGFIFELFLSEV